MDDAAGMRPPNRTSGYWWVDMSAVSGLPEGNVAVQPCAYMQRSDVWLILGQGNYLTPDALSGGVIIGRALPPGSA